MKRSIIFAALLVSIALFYFNFSLERNKEFKLKTNYSWLKDGDILFQDTGGELGEAIKIATKSKYSHCAMIIKDGENFRVFEAIGPVQFTPIAEWVTHGNNNEFKAYRLKDSKKITNELIKLWKLKAINYLGKPYDHVFEWSDDKIYCSELVWKMYESIGIEISVQKQLKDFDLSNILVKQQIQKRYGAKIPYTEKVVSPQDLVESALLQEVKH